MLTPDTFYNRLADMYDGMTQFETRIDAQRALLAELLLRYPARRAVDMGCGTGVHAVALAQLGLDVTGLDISAGMLEKARAHARDAGAAVEFLEGDFLAAVPRIPADLLLCLGNSLPHLESRAALTAVLAHWRSLLGDEGRAVIQLLNYARVLDSGERIVNIRRDGEATIVRFYDFLEETLRFNILTIRDEKARLSHDLQSTMLFPFLRADLETSAQYAGFRSAEFFGSLRLTPFDEKSTDLVAVLR